MAKKEPKVVLEEFINHLTVKKELVEYTRKEVPTPGQAEGAAMMVEYVHSDTKNPFELAMVTTPNLETVAKVRFPLTRELTEEQIDSISSDVLKLAGGVEGNLSLGGNRIVLSYTMMRKESDNIADASRALSETITRGTSYGQGLRSIFEKSFGLATDPGGEKWYQYKLGQPVKLTAAEMNQLQGGDIGDGVASIVAAGLGSYFGVVGGIVVGIIAYIEEEAINHPEQFVPIINPPRPSGPSGPYGPSKGTYCFTGDTRMQTSRGMIAMADVVTGDRISYSTNGVEHTTTVTGLDRHEGQFEMVEIVTTKGSIMATADHPFLHEGQWIRADQLKGGAVLSVKPAPKASLVFNVRTESGLYTVGDCHLLATGQTAAAILAIGQTPATIHATL